MNRKIISMLMALIILSATISTASAATLRLVQKNPSDWSETETGKEAILTYNPSGSTFDYNIVGNVPSSEPYSLIYYKDQENRFVDWGIVGAVIVETITPTGTDNAINIAGSVDIGNIPQVGDFNYVNGAKIWLVPKSNIHTGDDGITMYPDWNPSMYLFEENLRDTNNFDIPNTSKFITYTKVEAQDTEATSDGTATVLCGVIEASETATVGFSADNVDFGDIIPGTNSDGVLTIDATETPGDGCQNVEKKVSYTIVPGSWSKSGITEPGIVTTVVTSPLPTLVVTTTSTVDVTLNVAVNEDVTHGIYTSTITIDATY